MGVGLKFRVTNHKCHHDYFRWTMLCWNCSSRGIKRTPEGRKKKTTKRTSSIVESFTSRFDQRRVTAHLERDAVLRLVKEFKRNVNVSNGYKIFLGLKNPNRFFVKRSEASCTAQDHSVPPKTRFRFNLPRFRKNALGSSDRRTGAHGCEDIQSWIQWSWCFKREKKIPLLPAFFCPQAAFGRSF